MDKKDATARDFEFSMISSAVILKGMGNFMFNAKQLVEKHDFLLYYKAIKQKKSPQGDI